MDSNTVRVLSLDGGGIRGLFSVYFLEKFCNHANIDEANLYKYFDLIVGTSIGGIVALGLSKGKQVSYLKNFFYDKGKVIFPPFEYQDGLGSNSETQIGYRSDHMASTLLSLNSRASLYEQQPLLDAIKVVLGDDKMSNLVGNVVVTSWNEDTHSPIMFSNIEGYEPFVQGANEYSYNVGLATSSAPLFFPKAQFNGKTYIDGGVIQNNPSMTALSIAKRLYPTKKRMCLLSVGTGSHFPKQEDVLSSQYDRSWTWNLDQLRLTDFSMTPPNVEYIMYLLNHVFMGGVQRLTNAQIKFMAESMYENIHYFRFQHEFADTENVGLDHADDGSLDKLTQACDVQYEKDKENIDNFIEHFRI